MPVLNRIAALSDQMTAWRHHLHAHPELGFECHDTAAWIAERLREIGVDEIHEGIGRTGIVAIIEGQEAGPTLGLRADMDALPITEATGADYASTVPGVMHACGHDGHVTMLLGAAAYLAETRRFAGRVALIFQPAEEDGGGAQVMVEEGMMDRFGISEVYGIHNSPNSDFGHFYTNEGALMAAVDSVFVTLRGQGGHGATPHLTVDPIPAAIGMIGGLQTVVSRNLPPLKELVVSVTQIHSGSAENIIPDEAWFCATVRSFDPEVRQLAHRRICEMVNGHAAAYGVTAEIDYQWGYPPTVNHPAQARFAAEVAREVAGEAAVDGDTQREMGAEDFAYMLEARPGAYLYLGTGPGAGLHTAGFNFNDEAAPYGASLFARLAERALPLGGGEEALTTRRAAR